MSSHPDADAFVQAILRDPADLTTRLVFADWLEESGIPSNVAWAYFIRLSAQIATSPPGVRRENLITETYTHLDKILARVAVPARRFVVHHAALRQLLPLDRFRVSLGDFRPDPGATLLVSEQLARLYRLFPLGLTRSELLIAVRPDYLNTLVLTDLENLLGVPMLAVAGDGQEIEDATNRTYPVPPPQWVTTAIR